MEMVSTRQDEPTVTENEREAAAVQAREATLDAVAKMRMDDDGSPPAPAWVSEEVSS